MRSLTFLSSVAALLMVGVGPSHADVIENYDFSGTLATPIGGATSVTGTFTVDFTTSAVTAFDFSTPTGTVDATHFFAGITTFAATSPNAQFVDLFFNDLFGDSFVLLFETSLTNFKDDASTALYTGLVTDPGGNNASRLDCTGVLFVCSTFGFSNFSSGAASPVVTAPPPAAPEPGSFALLGAALAGLGVVRRRRA